MLIKLGYYFLYTVYPILAYQDWKVYETDGYIKP